MEEETGQEQPKRTGRSALETNLFTWLQALTLALTVLVFLSVFVGRVVRVDGSSMVPTLHDGDILLLQSAGYTPAQGDIVVLAKKTTLITRPIVKRVAAVGGQTVEIDYDAGEVRVDGVPLEEPYLNEPMRYPPSAALSIQTVTVPEGCIFVLGDNRNNSTDSRHQELGVIDCRYVLGRALCIVLPFENFGALGG